MMNTLTLKNQVSVFDFSNFDKALKSATVMAHSGFCPESLRNKPHDILMAIQFGHDVGLSVLQSLTNIAVINGRPSLWGDAMMGICKRSPDFDFCHETFDEKTMTASCEAKRKGEESQTRTFSKQDAESAKLWGKVGSSGKPTPWVLYPKRMLQMRARAFALRDVFPHLLGGILSVEEAREIREYSFREQTQESSTGETIKEKLRQREQPPVIDGEVIEQETTPLPLEQEDEPNKVSLETFNLLTDLIEAQQIEEDKIEKWLERATVDSLCDLTESQAQAIVVMLKRWEERKASVQDCS